MKLIALAGALAWIAATPTHAADRIGETCSGTETVRVGVEAPRSFPYSITFSADLARKTYCYGDCRPDHTYPIADSTSVPIKLANLDSDGQKRMLLFDPRSGALTDDQKFHALDWVTRKARATCKAAPFHEPAVLEAIHSH